MMNGLEKFGKYRFIGIDAKVDVTSLRPFFYFGKFGKNAIETLKQTIRDGKANHTILFGHWPAALHYSHEFQTTMDMLKLGTEVPLLAHVFGHLHANWFYPNGMKARLEGHLELEALDFKTRHSMRVMAIDNGMFSFVDTKFDEYPIILITNPKDAKFLGREPIARMFRGKIRIMVFSPSQVRQVDVSINGVYIGRAVFSKVWSVDWNPARYSTGIHKISVSAIDGNGQRTVEQEFSLDGSIPALSTYDDYVGRLLSVPWNMALQMAYISMLLPTISFMLIALFVDDGFWSKQFLLIAKFEPILYLFLLGYGGLLIILMYELYLLVYHSF
jgi:hypothetical protein